MFFIFLNYVVITLFLLKNIFVFFLFLGNAAVFRYLIKGYEAAEKDFSQEAEAEPALKYLKATHDLVHAQDAEAAARLIETYDLCLDHIPSKFIKTKEVKYFNNVVFLISFHRYYLNDFIVFLFIDIQ